LLVEDPNSIPDYGPIVAQAAQIDSTCYLEARKQTEDYCSRTHCPARNSRAADYVLLVPARTRFDSNGGGNLTPVLIWALPSSSDLLSLTAAFSS
jgi:hypothetical protein